MTFGPPASGIERLLLARPMGFQFEQHIGPGDTFEGIYFIPMWGVRGIRMTAAGLIGLVSDRSGQLEEVMRTNGISVEYWRKEKRERASQRFSLRPPEHNAREGSIAACWRAKLLSKEHNGITFFGPDFYELKVEVEW